MKHAWLLSIVMIGCEAPGPPPRPRPRPPCADEMHEVGGCLTCASWAKCWDERQVAEPVHGGLFCRCKP
jgi:hypothetical protein